jgi:hypothetical protein
MAEGAEEKFEGGADTLRDCFQGLAQTDVGAPKRRKGKQLQLARPGAVGLFQYTRNPSGIAPTFGNAIAAIQSFGVSCRYDVFHDKLIIEGIEVRAGGDGYASLDHQVLKFREMVWQRKKFDPGAQHTRDALVNESLNHMFDPVRDYLDELQWDGVPRIDRWLIDYCRAADTPLVRAFARKVLIAAVRRVREPGCKFDFILILEGKQGVGKSSLLRILAGDENFSDNEILGYQKREQQEAVQGIWIYELCELDGLTKAEISSVKLFASKQCDIARAAYDRSRSDRKRRCIFVATTNEDTYLRDATGNRRFWPVKVGKIDLEAVRRDRDQLWAEAAFAEAEGEGLVIPEALWSQAAIEQKARRERDVWEDVIGGHLAPLMGKGIGAGLEGRWAVAVDDGGARQFRVSTTYILGEILRLSIERQGDAVSKHLASVMKDMGWTRHENVIRITGKSCRGFTKVIEQADEGERRQKPIDQLKQQMVPLAVPLAVKRRKL